MKRVRPIGLAAASTAWIGMALPINLAVAAPPERPTPVPAAAPASPTVLDVALNSEGQLKANVVDSEGSAVTKAEIRLWPGQEVVAKGITDKAGNVTLTNVTGGVYQISCGQGLTSARLWASDTAPPSAVKTVMIVADSSVVRGQRPFGSLISPDALLVAAVIAAAIAVPIAIHNSRNDQGSGS